MSERVCFTLQVRTDRLDEYRARHESVWPEMLAEIAMSGRRNYSIFLREDGLLIGYYETDSDEMSAVYLERSEVAGLWEMQMAEFFEEVPGRADHVAHIPEVFNLNDATVAADHATP